MGGTGTTSTAGAGVDVGALTGATGADLGIGADLSGAATTLAGTDIATTIGGEGIGTAIGADLSAEGTSALVASGAGGLATDAVVGSVGADIAGSAAVDAAVGSVAADAAGTVAVDAIAADAGGSLLGDAAVAALAWVVCTELTVQGKMPLKYYRYGAHHFSTYDERGLQGYYIWAIPTVLHLRAKPNSLYSKFIASIFVPRAQYLAAISGCRTAKKTLFGAVVTVITYAFCWILSRTIARNYNSKLAMESIYTLNRNTTRKVSNG